MRNPSSIIMALSVLFASCSMDGAITEPTPDLTDNVEIPANPSEDESPVEDETPSDSTGTGGSLNGENENLGSGDNLDSEDVIEPELLTSIRLVPKSGKQYAREANEYVIEYPSGLNGPVVIEDSEEYRYEICSDNTVKLTPSTRGKINVKVFVGNYYNSCVLEVYDRLEFKLCSEFSHELNPVPSISLKVYNVYFILENNNLPVVDKQYDITYEYQQTMTGSDAYQTGTGRIGINSKYLVGTDTVNDSNTSGATFKYKSITVSGIKDKYIEFSVQKDVFFDHYGDETTIDFIYE